ncbi:hypothetical protein CFN78_18055 [Amycolatopsis antarctica]|uniref:Secreted protein n=1 Tax=Amycolatopsis antarctica TaxID=1854586 RepID=A0A263D2M8_9PSEU|nr:hypothetical protein [Amycolatopsis antarctica]OZM71736.1 hypothetical protein CFN78_18055 [Amycolatopsis antarctica]
MVARKPLVGVLMTGAFLLLGSVAGNAAADPRTAANPTESVGTASGATPAEACPYPGHQWKHPLDVGIVCDTRSAIVNLPGYPAQEVAIGGDYFVHYDSGDGWRRLGNIEVNRQVPPSELGLDGGGDGQLRTVGKDNRDYCVTFTEGKWTAWAPC